MEGIEQRIESRKRFIEVLLIVVSLLAVLKVTPELEIGEISSGNFQLGSFLLLLFVILAIVYYASLDRGWVHGKIYGKILCLFLSVVFAAIIGLAMGITISIESADVNVGQLIGALYYVVLTIFLYLALDVQ